MKYRLVFDDLEEGARRSPNPVIAKLAFGLIFEARSLKRAEVMGKEFADLADELGRWHIEPERRS